MKKIILFFSLLVFLASVSSAATFVVNKIEIRGLQRITPETVNSYLPIKRGQTLRPGETGEIISTLYKTAFFEHISLSREGNTLIINVVERATIGKLTISGNSYIPTDKLTSVMKSLDIAEGRVYNRAMLERIKQSLLNQYYELGRYNARVEVLATPMSRNRMLVKITISEGLVAKIRRINIIGNKAFTETELNKRLTLSTPGLFTFITQKDRYSQEKLDESLENLRNFYLDNGYVRFAVKSSQVAITPDRKAIYLTIVVNEGAPYTISGTNVEGNFILPRAEMNKLIDTKAGQTFSRQRIMDVEKAISESLGDKGYIFTTVGVRPVIDDVKHTVFVTFEVKPGNRTYVRHIYFTDNSKTNDEVLRRKIQQMEAAVVSTSKLEQSKHELSLLPYIRDVQMSILPVQDSSDQVDVNYKMTEDNSAQMNVSLGYSQAQGPIISGGFNQKNFLGTGKTLGVNASRSAVQQFYGVNYTNPYYTPDGISRSLSFSVSRFNPKEAKALSRSYSTNQYDASVLYGIPIGQEKDAFNNLQLGYGYENTLINLANSGVSQQVQTFTNEHGRHYQQIDAVIGISRDSRDKSIFPTRGTLQTLGLTAYLPAGSGALRYFSSAYNLNWYQPIVGKFIATARGQLAYGRGLKGAEDFPFFKNFYAGGPGSVRGYEANSLGPKDSLNYATGGNALAVGSLGIILPSYLSENLRTTVFLDGGNAYNTYDNRNLGGSGSGPLRYSSGIEFAYLTGFGLIDISFAKPLNRQHGSATGSDHSDVFQFSLGANFG